MLTFIDLFAGIGGFRRGMELAGHKCVGFCEWDKYATYSYTSMHLATEEQREYLKSIEKINKRQKEIEKDEYKNGEWYSNDIRSVDAANVPKCDCWCFGAPCQDFSIAGERKGLEGDRSSLVREVFRIIGEIEEEDRPEWIIYENVKGMFSSNKGFDYLEILIAMDELGYDIEWQLFNSKDWGVPQNRERVYTIGHLRKRGERKILPITGYSGTAGIKQVMQYDMPNRENTNRYRTYDENGIAPCIPANTMGNSATPCIKTVGKINEKRHHSLQNSIHSVDGICSALDCMQGGNRQPKIQIYGNIPGMYEQNGRVYGQDGICASIAARDYKNPKKIAIGLDKTANNQREIEIANCLTAREDRGLSNRKAEGTMILENKRIRKLTPRECFRLQGWSDEYFDRAALVNSDSQLYKQAGNGVTVNVVYEIAKRLEDCK